MYGFVREILADKGTQVFTIVPAAIVQDAVREMNVHGVGALLVSQGGRPVGIITERDILRYVVDAGRDPLKTSVAAAMSSDFVTVEPGTTVAEAMTLMTARRVRHLPVVDGHRVVGLISIGDAIRHVTIVQEREIRHLSDYITGGQG